LNIGAVDAKVDNHNHKDSDSAASTEAITRLESNIVANEKLIMKNNKNILQL
jgi:hypothetical protein